MVFLDLETIIATYETDFVRMDGRLPCIMVPWDGLFHDSRVHEDNILCLLYRCVSSVASLISFEWPVSELKHLQVK